MKKIFKEIIKWLTKEDTPYEDFKRNYCKYSKSHKNYRKY